MADYDKYYKTEDLFGEPYPELMEFFRKYTPKDNLLDLGCGQGRNSIALAKLGYNVTGIDNSKLGIDQMNKKSRSERLQVKGIVGDIYQFENYEKFDIVLLDSMFHFEKKDVKKETELIRKITTIIKKGCVFCVCIQDTGSKVKLLKDTISNSTIGFKIVNDSSLIYNYQNRESDHKSVTKYCMYIVRKDF